MDLTAARLLYSNASTSGKVTATKLLWPLQEDKTQNIFLKGN